MEKELTIGIATCGRPRVIRRCINSIKKYTKIPYKIIILDNTKAFTNKLDTSKIEKLADIYIDISDRKIGCSESNNIIAEYTDTEFLMHLDDDLYLRSDIVTPLLDFIKAHENSIISAGWFDTFYNSFRHSTMKYIIGEKNGEKMFAKVPILWEYGKNLDIDIIETDECLHSMLMRHDIYKKIKWDNNFEWKGDREDFFLSAKRAGIKSYMYIKDYVIHDPKPFKYGSLSYEFDGKKAKEYFYKKWNMIPLTGWDKYQVKPRPW